MVGDIAKGLKTNEENVRSEESRSGARLAKLAVAAGNPSAPDITQELNDLLSETPEVSAQTAKPELKSAETTPFRADAPAFVPQQLRELRNELQANAVGVQLPTMLSNIPDLSGGSRKNSLSPPPPQYMAATGFATSDAPLSPFGAATVSDSTGGVRLFEDQWSAEAVPDALKELWIPPCGPQPPRVLATAPPKSPAYAQSPQAYPYETPSVQQSDSLKSWVTPSTIAPDSPPLVATPTSYNVSMSLPHLLLPPPAPDLPPPPPPPMLDYVFSMRELLLKFRTSMGRVPPPWDLKLRYSIVDEKETAGSPKGSAGATLLKFVRGEASESEVVGKAKGAELMQMLQSSGEEESPTNHISRLLGLESPQKFDQQPQDWVGLLTNGGSTSKPPPKLASGDANWRSEYYASAHNEQGNHQSAKWKQSNASYLGGSSRTRRWA